MGQTLSLQSIFANWLPGRRPKNTVKPKTRKSSLPWQLEYSAAIERTVNIVKDEKVHRLAAKYGLHIVNFAWEDTARYKGSCVGPNISDMSIQAVFAEAYDAREAPPVTVLPVFRTPNFSDITTDLDPRDFTLLVGNATGQELRRISLYEFLDEPTRYLSNPDSWMGIEPKTLLAPRRDDKVLVSAQACFLPVPRGIKATFNPIVFNYQSYRKNPAVLTILATPQGTSVTVIHNEDDAFGGRSIWGQRLFHNANGERASLTGERESEFQGDKAGVASEGNTEKTMARESGLNMVLLIQVPLKQKEWVRSATGSGAPMMCCEFGSFKKEFREESDVENAVIGYGDPDGPFTEIDNLEIKRDERYPVRVTVQFYKATSNGIVSESDIAAIKAQINRVYNQGSYVGSLVTQGQTGRITEYEGAKVQPPGWWNDFWARRERETRKPREVIRQELAQLLGEDYEQKPVTELYLRDWLRNHRRSA